VAYKHLRLYLDTDAAEDALILGVDDGGVEPVLHFETAQEGVEPSVVQLDRYRVERLRDDLTLWLKGKLS
jgi:hypothetical protein